MPTDMKYDAADGKSMLRDQEALRRRKAAIGAASPVASPAPSPQPQAVSRPRPYTPSLTADEIRQKFMGGPATVPTGIPQQSAQNPAQPVQAQPQAPAAAPRLSARQGLEARAGAMDAQRDFKRAYDAGADRNTLGLIRSDMGAAREDAAGYDAQQMGAPGPAFTPERAEAGRKRLQEQATRIAAERNGQPLPGSTDTWSYEAGQKALPKNLQGQVFTHPEDQANYRDFSRFVGGAPSIDPATGLMTTPADREYQNVQQMREREMLDRKRAGQPIDFAPFDPAEAQRNQLAATDRYNDTIARGNAARAQRGEMAGQVRTLAESPVRAGAVQSKAQIAEAERARAAAEANASLIPGQTAAANADNQSKTVRSQYETANAGTMSARDVAKANEERARAEANAKAAPRRSDAEIRQIESGAGLSEAETNLRKKQLENYGRSGGPLDTATLSDDAANAVARRNAAKAMTGVDPVTIADKIIPKMASIARRFGGSRLVGKTGSVQDKTFGDMANELQDLKQIMGTGVGPLTDYAKVDPQGAKEVARGILANLPPPNENGQYEASWQLIGSPQMPEYVRLLNQFRASLEAMAR